MGDEIVVLFLEGARRAPAACGVEAALRAVRGVHEVSWNAATEKVRVAYDPAAVELRRVVEAVRAAGCDVRASHAVIDVDRIGCPWCGGRLEEALSAVRGVLHASVDLPTRRAIVSYLPGYVTPRDLADATREAGYHPTGHAVAARAAPPAGAHAGVADV